MVKKLLLHSVYDFCKILMSITILRYHYTKNGFNINRTQQLKRTKAGSAEKIQIE